MLGPREVTWRQGIDGGLGKRLVPAVEHLIDMVRINGPAASPPRAARGVLDQMLGAPRSQAVGIVPIRLPAAR